MSNRPFIHRRPRSDVYKQTLRVEIMNDHNRRGTEWSQRDGYFSLTIIIIIGVIQISSLNYVCVVKLTTDLIIFTSSLQSIIKVGLKTHFRIWLRKLKSH